MRVTDQYRCSSKKPIGARYFLLVLFALLPAKIASAQPVNPEPLTEREVLAQVLQRVPLMEVTEGEVAIEEGRGQAASAYPNPQLSYLREQTFGPLGTSEDSVSLAQVIDLGNRRGLYSEASEKRARAARQQGSVSRLFVAAEARLRFYEVLYRQTRVAALEGWVGRIDEALSIVTRREQRGDAATYDRRRLERERVVAAGRLETEHAALDRAGARMRAFLGSSLHNANVPVTGILLPESAPAALPELQASMGAHPDLVALDLQIEASSLERTAASRWWVPDLRLEGGWKGVKLGPQARADGFLLGASLSLPMWDQSSGLTRIAEGEVRAARGRRALRESELKGELDGIRSEAIRLRRAAVEFREQITAASGELMRIASAGYEGGELGLLELLDSYRGAADDALSALDMEHAARRAYIELDRLTGARLP